MNFQVLIFFFYAKVLKKISTSAKHTFQQKTSTLTTLFCSNFQLSCRIDEFQIGLVFSNSVPVKNKTSASK